MGNDICIKDFLNFSSVIWLFSLMRATVGNMRILSIEIVTFTLYLSVDKAGKGHQIVKQLQSSDHLVMVLIEHLKEPGGVSFYFPSMIDKPDNINYHSL